MTGIMKQFATAALVNASHHCLASRLLQAPSIYANRFLPRRSHPSARSTSCIASRAHHASMVRRRGSLSSSKRTKGALFGSPRSPADG